MHPPQNKILSDKYSVDFNSLIGKGSTGNVFRGLCLDPHPSTTAVKVIPLKEINNEVTSYLLQCELEALKALSKNPCPYLTKLKDIIVIDQQCFVIMELLEGGTLRDYITQVGKLEEKIAIRILKQILEAYRVIRDHKIVHRDLKPTNIMFLRYPVGDHFTAKIIDFGYCDNQAVKKKPQAYYNVGSPRYMSPEAYKQNMYTEKSDIWSIGIIFYEMLTGFTFDKGKDITETFQQIREKGIPIPARLSSKSKKILQIMLMFSPARRSHVDDVLAEITRKQDSQFEFLHGRKQAQPFQASMLTKDRENLHHFSPVKVLSIPKRESPKNLQRIKSHDRIRFSLLKQDLKNKVFFSHLPVKLNSGPANIQEKVSEKHIQSFSPEKYHEPLIPIPERSQPIMLRKSEDFEQKLNGYRNSFPVKVNFSTLQPVGSQKQMTVAKENEKDDIPQNARRQMRSQENHVRIEFEEARPRGNRIQTSQLPKNVGKTIAMQNNLGSPSKHIQTFNSPNSVIHQIKNSDFRGSMGISPRNTQLNSSFDVNFGSGSEVKGSNNGFHFSIPQRRSNIQQPNALKNSIFPHGDHPSPEKKSPLR